MDKKNTTKSKEKNIRIQTESERDKKKPKERQQQNFVDPVGRFLACLALLLLFLCGVRLSRGTGC